MATLLPLSPALGVRGCAHVTLPLSSLHPSIQQKTSTRKAGRSRDWWGGVLDWGWQRRSGTPPAPIFPAHVAHTQRDSARGPHPRVHVLFGGCSWFSRRLSHSSDPKPSLGSAGCAGITHGSTSCAARVGQLSSCLAPAWHGERGGSVSFNCLGKRSPPARLPSLARGAGTGPSRARGAVWCQELAVGER